MTQPIATINVSLDSPVIVAQAPAELDRAAAAWGRWQFPYISRLPDGQLLVRFSIEPDSVGSYGKPVAHAYSSDNGRTWRMGEPKPGCQVHEINGPAPEAGILLSNGDRLRPVQLRSMNAGSLNLPASACDFVCSYGYPRSLYRVEDLPKEFSAWRFQRLPAGASQWIEESATVHIPGDLRCVTFEKSRSAPPGVGRIGQVREGFLPLPFLWGKIRPAPDQSLWAVTCECRLFGGTPLYTPIFLRSTDHGHTWHMVSEIRYQGDEEADPLAKKRDGFTEPDYAFMPDGSIICLMRTMDGNGHGPLYLVHSDDMGRTWSRPVVFDSFGKMPQLLTLGNGVTLASYGASGGPGYFVVRATRDPSGRTWEAPVRTAVSPPQPGAWDTCGHTEMVPLDDHNVLIVYSDFNYPDKNDTKRKSILVRHVRIG